jgi:hypothetical protein
MAKSLREFMVLALSLAALALSANARQKPTGDWADLSHLSPNSEVRVVLADGRTLRGSPQSASADSLSINTARSQERLSRQDIKRVQLKGQGHRRRNTLIGFLVGTGGGLAIGAAVDASTEPSLFPNAGKAVISVLGAVIGTVVGVVIPTGGWQDIYRAP